MQRRRSPSHARSTILITLPGSTVEPLTCRLQVGGKAQVAIASSGYGDGAAC